MPRSRHRPHVPAVRPRHDPAHPVRRTHDLGQNDLVDSAVIRAVVEAAAARPGPIVELAAGTGRITVPLAGLGRPLTAVELDPRRVDTLRRRVGPRVHVRHDDLLSTPLPPRPHVVVANLPFHVTTAALRRLLADPNGTRLVLIVQWEVARRRAGIGNASLLTASWWPWFEFRVDRRIPSRAFRPRPAVDAGLLLVDRRSVPLVPARERFAYQRWVGQVFAASGSADRALARVDRLSRAQARVRCRAAEVDPAQPVGRITATQWAALWRSR